MQTLRSFLTFTTCPYPRPTPMSAYGAIKAPSTSAESLATRSYALANGLTLTTYPVSGSNTSPELIAYLAAVFNQELAGTYPRGSLH